MNNNWQTLLVITLSLVFSLMGVIIPRFVHAHHQLSLQEHNDWQCETNQLRHEIEKIHAVVLPKRPKKIQGHTCPHCGGETVREPCAWCGGYWEQEYKRKETNPDIFLKTQKARIEEKARQGYPQALPLLAHYDLAKTPDSTMSLLEETEKFLLWSD